MKNQMPSQPIANKREGNSAYELSFCERCASRDDCPYPGEHLCPDSRVVKDRRDRVNACS